MAWTNLSFLFGSILTSTKMTQLYNNFTAMAQGESGAPQVQNAAIANNAIDATKIAAGGVDTDELAALAVESAKIASSAVARAKISTSTGSASGTVNNGLSVAINMDAYSFAPDIRCNGTPTYVVPIAGTGAGADTPKFAILNSSGSSQSYSCAWRYIAA